jgi:hypothetical protein
MKKQNTGAARMRLMGVLDRGTFPSVAAATRAALEFAVDAHDHGHELSSLAVLMNKSDAANVNVTLARRHYWRTVAPELMAPDVLARLAAQDDRDSLLVLVADTDCDSHVVLTLTEMQEDLK